MPVTLRERDFQPLGYRQQIMEVLCPVGSTPDDLRSIEFWSPVARRLKAWLRLFIVAEDGSFYFDMVVVAVQDGVPVLKHLAGFYDEEASDAPDEEDGVRVEFVNERDGWRVVRVIDGYVIKDRIREKREARRQRTRYLNPPAKTAA